MHRVTNDKSGNLTVESGIKGMDVLKTTQSAFRNFHKCRFTSLPEVDDRFVGTSVDARWSYTPAFIRSNPRYEVVSASVEKIFSDVFFGPADTGIFSESVQATCYEMAAEVLKAHEGISKITLYMPNIHNFAFPLEKYGIENKDHTGKPDIFYPIDEPHGMISATVERTGGRSRL
jgi:urate oxidase